MVKSLVDLGFAFNGAGELRDKNGGKFKFTTQANYEELGDAITGWLYDFMQNKFGLIKTPIRPVSDPKNPKHTDNLPDKDFGFAFVSPMHTEKETILVLIHGSGAVRAGQWGRKLIINENLYEGSQIPYIEQALKRDWGLVILNTNYNFRIDENGKKVPLKFNATPEKHSQNAWGLLVDETKASTIHVVAHSAGGGSISKIMELYEDPRVKSIILTDSWFSGKICEALVINFIASKLSSGLKNPKPSLYELYAGTNEHDRTSAACINAAFYAMEHWDRFYTGKQKFIAEVARRVRGGSPSASRYLEENGYLSSDDDDQNGEAGSANVDMTGLGSI